MNINQAARGQQMSATNVNHRKRKSGCIGQRTQRKMDDLLKESG